jgi:hypothetical protein
MAVLAAVQLAEVRQKIAAQHAVVTWNKTELNAALQAVENVFQGTGKTALNNAIETASPGVFDANQKKLLIAFYVFQAAQREGA